MINVDIEELFQMFIISRKNVLFNFYKNKRFVGFLYIDENGFFVCEYEGYKCFDRVENIILEQKLLEVEIIFNPVIKENLLNQPKLNLMDYFLNLFFCKF